ncbi:hypothetical protein [Aeromonas enteropelogenes]|uniref:hypothetical protein n=1 Tax=Aeromonas enteropelogenes TaxID=29489 RepID=UPI003BA10733
MIGQVNARAGPLQSFLVAGAASGHRAGGAGQQLVIGQVNARAGPCSGSWSPANRWPSSRWCRPAAGDRSGSTRAGPLQLFLVTGATGGHRAGGAGQLPVIGRGVPGQGRCSGSWSPAQPVAIEQVVLASSW